MAADKLVSFLAKVIVQLQDRRYPTVLLIQSDSSAVTIDQAKAVSEQNCLSYIDYREEVLQKDDSQVELGVYLRGQLRDWLLLTASKERGIFINNIDELISSWDDSNRKAFFIDFLHLECNCQDDRNRRAPILLLSRHAGNYILPEEREGQGVVVNPAFIQ